MNYNYSKCQEKNKTELITATLNAELNSLNPRISHTHKIYY